MEKQLTGMQKHPAQCSTVNCEMLYKANHAGSLEKGDSFYLLLHISGDIFFLHCRYRFIKHEGLHITCWGKNAHHLLIYSLGLLHFLSKY